MRRRKHPTGLSSNNAQEVYDTLKGRTGSWESLQRRVDLANERLKELKEAGFEQSQFYKNHRYGFKMPEGLISKREMSKRLAEVNQFLNAKSSTVEGMKKARRDLLNTFSKSKNISNTVTEENLDRFLDFMDYYADMVEKQGRYIGTDEVAVDMFELQESLHLKKNDILNYADKFRDYKEDLKKKKPEDLLSGDETPEEKAKILRRKFSLQEYLNVIDKK